MRPLVFLADGESAKILKVGGKDEVRNFLAGLGFVSDTPITVISKLSGNLIVKVKDSRIAINEDMAKKIMVE